MSPCTRGFTLVEMLMVVTIVALVAVISIPGIIAARKYANEGSAITSLKTIGTQQILYRESDADGDDRNDYGTLEELRQFNMIDDVLGRGSKAGYRFEATYSATTSEELWFAIARPVVPGSTGDRYFGTNQTGSIFFTTSAVIPLDNATCARPAGCTPVE